jgi:predicted enzyme related to lactoylglutathione lyase
LELFVNSSTSRSRRALNRGAIPIARIILYVKDIPTVARFYQTHFGMTPLPSTEDGWQELTGEPGSCQIALHRASARQKGGAAVKIVFGIADVRGFVEERAAAGLKFGPIHEPGTFMFANAKDPAGNSIQISSRGLTLEPPEGM